MNDQPLCVPYHRKVSLRPIYNIHENLRGTIIISISYPRRTSPPQRASPAARRRPTHIHTHWHAEKREHESSSWLCSDTRKKKRHSAAHKSLHDGGSVRLWKQQQQQQPRGRAFFTLPRIVAPPPSFFFSSISRGTGGRKWAALHFSGRRVPLLALVRAGSTHTCSRYFPVAVGLCVFARARVYLFFSSATRLLFTAARSFVRAMTFERDWVGDVGGLGFLSRAESGTVVLWSEILSEKFTRDWGACSGSVGCRAWIFT